MTPKGNNITVKPKPREKVLASGIIIPDTAKQSNRDWGVIVEGAERLIDSYGNKAENGMRVYYFNTKAFRKGDEVIVSTKNCILWEQLPQQEKE